MMRDITTQNWLLSRHRKTTKDFYVKTKAQLQAQYDVENVFFKFDDDCSGTLDAKELQQMFEQHSIQINLADVKKLFDIVDKEKRGLLNLEQFKHFCESDKAQKFFKQKIKDVRSERLTSDGAYHCIQQLPFRFNIMLEYLSTMTKRHEKIDQIEKTGISRRKAERIMSYFEELFEMRSTNLNRDLVGMEEVKQRLYHTGQEMERMKKKAQEKLYNERKLLSTQKSSRANSRSGSPGASPLQRKRTMMIRQGSAKNTSAEKNKQALQRKMTFQRKDYRPISLKLSMCKDPV